MNNNFIYFKLPQWLNEYENSLTKTKFHNDEDKMEIAIKISYLNILNKTGGPFGCALFIKKNNHYEILSVGCNIVVNNKNCTLHAETVAIQMGQKKIEDYSFKNKNVELFTSCEPCAMCLGAILWSGVSKLVCSSKKEHAEEIGFKEGPVFKESYSYLEINNIKVIKNVLENKGKDVLHLYNSSKGEIYNA
jgi:tRNA(Arg) A34 adenosine deaminase TadA